MRTARPWGLLIVLLSIAGCSPAAATVAPGGSTQSAAPRRSPTPDATPSALATGSVMIEAPTPGPTPTPTSSLGGAWTDLKFPGTPGLENGLAGAIVLCQLPMLSGEIIRVVGSSDDGALVDIEVSATKVMVHEDQFERSGSLRSRSFEAAGVAGFSAAKGVKLAGPLAETTTLGTNLGSLPLLTSITGVVDCGKQERGSASLRLSGTLPEGRLDAVLPSPRVGCVVSHVSGTTTVTSSALIGVGGSPVLATVSVGPGRLLVVLEFPSGLSYTFQSAGGDLLGERTARVDGTATGTRSDGGTPQTVHVSGTATCGTLIYS